MLRVDLQVPRWLTASGLLDVIDRGIEHGLRATGTDATGTILVPEMKSKFVNPRPRYWLNVGFQVITPNLIQLDDDGVVYGPWLEGTSQRNRTSRFKGYAIWRRSRARVAKLAAKLIKREILADLRKTGLG